MTRDERRRRDEARHSEAVGALGTAFEGPVTEGQVDAFVAAARDRFEGRFRPEVRRSWRLAAALAAGTALAVLAAAFLWPEAHLRLGGQLPAVVSLPTERIEAAASAPSAAPQAGDVIVTGPNDPVTWEDVDTARVVVARSSRLRVALWDGATSVIELEVGRIRSNVRPRRSGQRYEVRTPYAVIRVVGTDFAVEHLPGEATVVTGYAGRVTVETRDGRPLGAVSAGEVLRVEAPRVAEADTPAAREPSGVSPDVPPAVADAGVEGTPAREPGPAAPHVRPAPAEARSAPGDDQPSMGKAADAQETEGVGAPALPAVADVLSEARRLLSAGEDERALVLLSAHEERSWRVQALLGDALRVQGRLAEARAAYGRALEAAGEPPPRGLLIDHATLLERDPSAAPEAAARAWQRYLDYYPGGREAAAAHDALATAAIRAGATVRAGVHLRAILDDHASSPEAARALARLGRLLIAAERWDDAEALFARWSDDPRAICAETAVVGLVRVRVGQGRADDARRLLQSYRERFPEGRRAAEISRLESALAVE